MDLLAIGVPEAEAAKKAGLPTTHQGAMRKPAVIAYMRDRQALKLHGYLVPLSMNALQEVLTGPDFTGAAKVAAARLVLSAAQWLRASAEGSPPAGAGGQEPPPGADAPALGDLRAMAAALDGMRARLERAEPIDVTPAASPVDL